MSRNDLILSSRESGGDLADGGALGTTLMPGGGVCQSGFGSPSGGARTGIARMTDCRESTTLQTACHRLDPRKMHVDLYTKEKIIYV